MHRFVFIVCFLVPAIVSDVWPPPDLMEELVYPLHQMCTEQLAITEAAHASYNLATNTPDMKCYMKCLMLQSKWMTPDGEINYDFIIDNTHPSVKDILEAAIPQCKVIEKGADPCDYAYNFNVCLQQVDPVHWFLP